MIYMRKAGPKDLLAIMKIIEEARAFLALFHDPLPLDNLDLSPLFIISLI